MQRAIIFDFDGVVADSEPIHLMMFQRILGEIGIFLSREEYYAAYLGYDDKGCFEAVLAAHGRPSAPAYIEELVSRKAKVMIDHLKDNLVIYPGVVTFVRAASSQYRLAIASGALRQEIELVLEHAGIRKEFEHITSAEDVVHGKPHPEAFLHAMRMLNQRATEAVTPLDAEHCLVIEDSIPGIRGARAAGMKTLAVANTHSVEELEEADVVTTSLVDVSVSDLERHFWPSE